MHSAIEIEQPLLNDSKIRKSKRVPVPSEHYTKQSVKDPKIIKQLIKASEKYEISKLIQELKDEEEMIKEENEPSTTVKSETVSHSKMEVIDVDKDDPKSKLEVPFDFQEKIISEFQAFIKLYKEIVSGKNKSSKDFDESFYDNKHNLYLLAKLYYLCEENYYEANALQLWKDLSKCFTEEELATMNQNPKEFYKKHLFFFDRFSKTNKTKEDLLEVLKLNVDYLSDPYTFYAPDSGNFTITQEFLDETAKHQCSLLKGFVNVLGIDSQLFSIANIVKTHPDEIIDVVSQNPDLYGFIQDTKKTYQYKKKITLHEYSNYQKESSIRMPQYVKDKNGMIQFAVNIDFDGWKEHMDELVAKVPPEWLFDSKKDGMRVVNQKIRGVNLPQFFLKVEGAWTGGHEENLRLRAVNFNHGPDSCVWYTIGTESSKDFRAFVKDHYNLDIHKDEGLWFGDIDLCIKNKIKIQYFVQEPGDVVLLGPGCLHWVRCLGITMNSAWNICSQDKLQFEKAFEREKINREISFKSIIPIKHISLNLFKQDFESLPRDLQIYLGEKLVELYSEEMKAYDEFMRKYPATTFTPEDKGSSVYNCALCNYETLNFYTYCAGCSAQKKPKRIAVLTCLNCYDAHLKECKTEGSQIYFYCKLTPDTVRKFQQLLAKVKNGSPEDLAPFKNLSQYLDGLSGDGQATAKTANNKETPVTEKKEAELKRQKSETKNKDTEKTISLDPKGKNEKMEEEKLDNQDEKQDDEAGADEGEKEQTSKKKGSSKKASNNSDKKKGKSSQKGGKNANVKVSLSNEPISESNKPEMEENNENEVEPGKRKLPCGDEEDDKGYVIKKKVKTNMIDLDRENSGTQQDEGKTEVSQSQNSAKSSLQIKGNDKEEVVGRHAHDNFFINKLSDQ